MFCLYMVGLVGFEPTASIVSGWHSSSELQTLIILADSRGLEPLTLLGPQCSKLPQAPACVYYPNS